MTFDSANGSSDVELSGKYDVTTITKGSGEKRGAYSVIPMEQALIYLVESEVTTVVSNSKVRVKQDDILTAGLWTVGGVEYDDKPNFTKTTKFDAVFIETFGNPVSVTAAGSGIQVINQNRDVSIKRENGLVSGTVKTFAEERYDENLTWQFGPHSGETKYHSLESKAYDVKANPSTPDHPNLTRTTTTISALNRMMRVDGPNTDIFGEPNGTTYSMAPALPSGWNDESHDRVVTTETLNGSVKTLVSVEGEGGLDS